MSHFKHPIFITSVLLAFAVGGGGYLLWGKMQLPSPGLHAASRMSLTERVETSGRVKAAEDLDLAFEKSGKVSRVNADIGGAVRQGDIIVALENGELAAGIAQAAANLNAQEAKLDELKKGMRPEELSLAETKVAAARQSASDLEGSLLEAVKGSYTVADDAVRGKADQMFTSPRSIMPQLNFRDSAEGSIETGRVAIEKVLADWQSSIASVAVGGDLSEAADAARDNLHQTANFLDVLSLAVNAATPTNVISQTTISGWQSAVSSARANVNASAAGLSLLKGQLNSARANFTMSENELTLKKAGATPETIAAQTAAVDSARASLEAIRVQFDKSVIRAPIDGVLTREDAKVGEIVEPGVPLVSLASAAHFEIETSISEADVAKIKAGNQAAVTLDAYGNAVEFPAEVLSIDPAAVVSGGVSSYRVVLRFTADDMRIKEGLTANVSILAGAKENVLAVPETAIIQRGDDTIILVGTSGGGVEERKVVTGMRSIAGMVEIVSGLKDGERFAPFGRGR